MGKSPYLQTWHKMPTPTASDAASSALRQTLLPGSDYLPVDIPCESAPLRNPYLSRGRQIGGRKKSSGTIKTDPVPAKKAAEAGNLSAPEMKSSEPNRLYLRRWYPS